VADNVPVYIEPGEDFPIFRTTERVIQTGIGLIYYVSSEKRDIRPYLGLDIYLGYQNLPYQTTEDNVVVYRNGSLRQISSRALVGLQIPIVRRVSLYGEIGIEYSHRERFVFGGQKLDIRYLGSFTSGVGVIFFLF
jgi:hypothetical protein